MRLGGLESVVILLIVLLLFGASKLPSLAKSAGESIRIFKKESQVSEDSDSDSEKESA